ncbi:ImmA/IrrE family metallo-endopeptidase [Oenococcus oeni]
MKGEFVLKMSAKNIATEYQYKDIYSSDFLKQFNKYLPEGADIGSMKLSIADPAIKVKGIVGKMNIQLQPAKLEEAGILENHGNSNRIIEYNSNDNERRIRFTISHELGHLPLGHSNSSEIKHRNTVNLTGYTYEERHQESQANSFAAILLMPRKLIKILIEYWVERFNHDKWTLDASELDKMTSFLAEKLNVSYEAMSIRLETLGINN